MLPVQTPQRKPALAGRNQYSFGGISRRNRRNRGKPFALRKFPLPYRRVGNLGQKRERPDAARTRVLAPPEAFLRCSLRERLLPRRSSGRRALGGMEKTC